MRFADYYSLIVGIVMFVQWIFFIGSGNVPEFQTAPIEISSHLAADALTAILLIITGAGIMRSSVWQTCFLTKKG